MAGVLSGWIGRSSILALGIAAGWFGARRLSARTDAIPAAEKQTAPVERRDLSATVLATGVIRPRVGAQVAVGSRASGVVEKLHVTVGDRVAPGQLLAELSRVEMETQVRRAEAVLLSATTDLDFTESELNRTRQLAAVGGVSVADLSAAQRTFESAGARVREAKAALDAANTLLGYTSIRAPIGGVVASVSTQEGETVAASFAAPTFLTIVDLARLEVWAYVDETDIGRIQAGQRATFTVDTYPGQPFTGRVTAIRPAAEVRDNVVNYVTLISFSNRPDRLLRPEMTTTINIELAGKTDALSVPNGALRRDAGGAYVMVATATTVDRRTVTVGFRSADFTEVTSGVKAGERVVLGSAITITPEPAAPPIRGPR